MNFLNENLEEDYYLKKTTDKEVEDLLLRGHYLGAWPFAGSKYKNYIYGIYLRREGRQHVLGPIVPDSDVYEDDILIGCVVYGFPEPHASEYVSKWIRRLLSPNESIDDIYKNIKLIVQKDEEELKKAQYRGYSYEPKAKKTIQTILNITNIQDYQILELKRLYILPEFDKKNIESFSISRGNQMVFEQNPQIQAIVSFSDSRVGHEGKVYQATNALYAGKNKRGLHRYIYLRSDLVSTIKKYQKYYNLLVYQYPQKKTEKSIIKKNQLIFQEPMKLSKKEKIIVKYLKDKLPHLTDDSLKSAVEKILDMIEKSPQKTLTFKEVYDFLIKEYLTKKIVNFLNENISSSNKNYQEQLGMKIGLRDLLNDTKRDLSKYSEEFVKGYKKVQKDEKWRRWNEKITIALSRIGDFFKK